ncbi:MAG: hypothetical protein Q7R66_02845 [Undibacterium sp.]|uniref:hypothetical protein n=1 Tax=Undibacterium sp. TaxID=1914977 RepID=UPI002724EA9F|nr:hypothetical protein [Undibacterium sp.]MDO8651110.1 hypothetical protein [Undibacterium sp.]
MHLPFFRQAVLKLNLSRLIFILLCALSLSACVSPSYDGTSGEIPGNTQLALSPNGQRVLVSWNDSSRKLHAKLLDLKGSEVATTREVALPPNTLTTAFANNNEQILVTTWDKQVNQLLKINLSDDSARLIYQSRYNLRFPLEVSDENYVFLEGQDTENRNNLWQRYQHGLKTILNYKNYNSAAPLNVVKDALFILEPWSPPAFRNLSGELPQGLRALVDKTTFDIQCADRSPLTCLRKNLYYGDQGSYSTMEILNGKQRCEIAGRWIDSSEVLISRDGSSVVFHAAILEHGGTRAIYFIKNVGQTCTASSIAISGKTMR